MNHESIKFTVKRTDTQRAKALVPSPTWKIREDAFELSSADLHSRALSHPPGLLSRKEGKEHVGEDTEDIYEDFREASDVLKHGGQRISSILKLPSRISSDS